MIKLKIHILFEHASDLKPFGCAYIRDLIPLQYPTNLDQFEVTYGLGYQKADIIILERLWKPGLSYQEAERIVEQIKKDHACFIYSIDDDLIDLPSVSVPQKMLVRFFARRADGIIVSTQNLKDRFRLLNNGVFCVPNALDERLFLGARNIGQPKDKNITTIGYMGTFTHDEDLMLVVQSLRKILRENPTSLELQIVGGLSAPTFLRLLQGLPVKILTVPVEDVAYPNFVKWMVRNLNWDLGIAPLEATVFNSYKSDIKFLDYSLLGIPGLYSKVPSYNETIVHLDTGLLVEDNTGAWYESLERMIKDPPFRAAIAGRAFDYVLNHRTLIECAVNWQQAVIKIYESRYGEGN